MKFSDTETRKVWDAVYDAETLNSDPDVARNLADKVKLSLSQNNAHALQVARSNQLESIKEGLMKFFCVLIFLAFVSGTVFGILLLTANNDYAGFGPSKVGKHDVAALNDYFRPKTVDLVNRQRSHSPTGESAWASQYKVDGKTLCVYVWSDKIKPENFAVQEGSC